MPSTCVSMEVWVYDFQVMCVGLKGVYCIAALIRPLLANAMDALSGAAFVG